MFDMDLVVFLIALGIAAASPGPALAAIIATVLSGGALRAIWFSVGIALGDIVWLAFSIGGLALITQKIPMIFIAIKIAGIVYLLYLAFKIWNSTPEENDLPFETEEQSIITRLLAGFSITMGNPKVMLFYLALLPSIINLENVSAGKFLALIASVFVVLGIVFTVYILLASKARQIFTSKGSVSVLNKATATAMGGAAVWIASK